MKATPDLERLSTRVLNKKAHPLEIVQIKYTLVKALRLKSPSSSQNFVLDSFTDIFKILPCRKALALLETSIDEEPSVWQLIKSF